MNKIIVIGNLGNDPEMRYTPNGQSVTEFRIASNRRYTTADGERREETEWFRVSAFGRLADICNQYLSKGRQVYVEGTLRSGAFMDREGQPRASLDIRANDIQFLGGRDDSGSYAPAGQTREYSDRGYGGSGGGLDDVDDLPF